MSYVLKITYVTNSGDYWRETRYWSRASRLWQIHACNCVGYKTAAAAEGQVTRLRKKGFLLPPGWTVFSFGWELVPDAVAG